MPRKPDDEPPESFPIFWTPPPRSIITGHRVSTAAHLRPIKTLKLPWRWWIAELPMRWLAKSMSKASLQELSAQENIPEAEE